MRKITELIIHCSATQEGQDFSAADIRRWHVDDNHWSDIGYHFVIRLDGTIELGRPIQQAGAHTSGHNQNSIGICYVGGLDHNLRAKDTRTPEQKRSLLYLLIVLLRMYPHATIHSHHDFAAKDCPCFDAGREYRELMEKDEGED